MNSYKMMLAVSFWLALTAWLPGDQVLVESPKEFLIYNRHNRSWTLPPVKGKGQVVVDFWHRIDYPKAAGWCPCWQLEVNGKNLTSMGTRRLSRLLNKPTSHYHTWHGTFTVDNKSDKWKSLYQPDYHAQDKLFSPPDPEASHVVIDISDVISRDQKNEIAIRFGGVPSWYYTQHQIFDRKPALAVRGFKVLQCDQPSKLVPVVKELPRVTMYQLETPSYVLGKTGEQLLLTSKGVSVPIVSRYSLPGKKWVEMKGESTLVTPLYKVNRVIIRHRHRIDFYDTVTSLSDKLIGLKYRNGSSIASFDPVYVAGDSSPSATEFATGRNPSVFASLPQKKFGIGFIAVDDVTRIQNISRCDSDAFYIGSDTFALSPGESRTIEWSVYPVTTSDYFDFINTVRRDWKVNFPIQGTLTLSMNCFIKWQEKNARSIVKVLGAYANSFGVHFWNHLHQKATENYEGGLWGIGREGKKVRVHTKDQTVIEADPSPMNEFEKFCIAQCRKFTPQVKILTYVHNQISVAADDDQYESSRLIHSNGSKGVYGKAGKLFIPTLHNAFGQRFLKFIDWTFENFDLDGLYWDEMNHCTRRIDYGTNRWDRVSVELDDNFEVKRKISYVPLLKLPFTLMCMEKIIHEHGKLLFGNFSPETRSETRYHFPRFEETYSTRWVALSHLYTPIQLGDMLTLNNTPKDMAKDQRLALYRGALYYHYLGNTGCQTLTSYMFPFTPIELHSGWLVGKERILTALSGDFGWYGKDILAQTHVFDELGREVPDYPVTTIATKQGTRVVLDLKPQHCAALVAIPVTAQLADVTLHHITFSNGIFEGTAKGHGRVILTKDGEKKTFTVKGTLKIRF